MKFMDVNDNVHPGGNYFVSVFEKVTLFNVVQYIQRAFSLYIAAVDNETTVFSFIDAAMSIRYTLVSSSLNTSG